MNYPEAVKQARQDFAKVVGTVIEVDTLLGYSQHDSCVWYFDPPVRVLVVETSDDDITRTCYEFVDPYWDVMLVEELLKPEHRRDGDLPHDAGSFMVDGVSYEFSGEIL